MIKSDKYEVFLEGDINQLMREFCNIARALVSAIGKRYANLFSVLDDRMQVLTFMQVCQKRLMDDFDNTVIENGCHYVIDKNDLDIIRLAADEIKKKKDNTEE